MSEIDSKQKKRTIVIFNFFVIVQLIQSGKHLQNPHEMSGQYEGDIVLPPPSVTRNGLRSTVYRWPRKRVPYIISTSFSSNQAQSIETALRTIESVSCVRFVKRSNEPDYVRVTVRFVFSVINILKS